MRISGWRSDDCSSDRSATAMGRRAERQGMRGGRAYEAETMVRKHNAGVTEQRGLRQYIERGTEWLRDAGQRISGRLHAFAATFSRALDRARRHSAAAQRQDARPARRTREPAPPRPAIRTAQERARGSKEVGPRVGAV